MTNAAQLVNDSRSRYASADYANFFATDNYQLADLVGETVVAVTVVAVTVFVVAPGSVGRVTWRHPPCCPESVVLPFTRRIAPAMLAIPRTTSKRFMKPICDLRWSDDF